MLVFPNCKINLGLIIPGKRNDGYHNIETVFFPVPLNDALEIITSTGPAQPSVTVFSASGIPIHGDVHDNLCMKAYYLLKKDFPHLPAVNIHLHKVIPMGAGLGGGSADAAFTITALNAKYSLNISNEQLASYALQLGSDCPFFVINKPCIATGRGEILQEINVGLPGYALLLVYPGIHVNTGWAFGQLNITRGDAMHAGNRYLSLTTIISQPLSSWKEGLRNDFEIPVFEKYPEIKAIKESFYEKGALYASMSGSGSTVYGIFNKNNHPVLSFPEHYIVRSMIL